ncbi:MAG: hypothetical protein F4W95_00990 [Chloroflexi bacterium]|nr:hypothetical protein [Chloroflexota bacterium]MYD47041.1 hypothetical protein [Chloroflexota bacterium]
MPQRRQHLYICTTWLPRLLSGENSCEWAVRFKVHYRDWDKPPSDFDQAQWLLGHTALLNRQRRGWESRGHRGLVEGKNAFRLRGKTATLAALDDCGATIIDVKTGQERP